MNGGYWLRWYDVEGFDRLKTFTYNGRKYNINRESLFFLHGWCPWLKDNVWNPWRQVYNMVYRWWYATGLLVYEEPLDELHGVEKAIEPITWPEAKEKWTPALVQAVNLSRLEQKYNKHVTYGGFKMDWKVVLIVGFAMVLVLLFLTGRLLI